MKFDLLRFVRCVLDRSHDYKNSRSRRGFATCQKCGHRKRWR